MSIEIFAKTDCTFKRTNDNTENNFIFIFPGTSGKKHIVLALNKYNLSDLSYIQSLYYALCISKTQYEPNNLNISRGLGPSMKVDEDGLSAESDCYLYYNKSANFQDMGKFSPKGLIGNIDYSSSDYKAAQKIYEVTGGDLNKTINDIGITLGLRMLSERSWKKRNYKRLKEGETIEIPKNSIPKLKVIIQKYNSEQSKKSDHSEIREAESKANQKAEKQRQKDKNVIKKRLKSAITELTKRNDEVLRCIRKYNESLDKIKQLFPTPPEENDIDVFNIKKYEDKEAISRFSIMSLKTPVPGMNFICANDDAINSFVDIIYQKNHPQSNSKNSELPTRIQL